MKIVSKPWAQGDGGVHAVYSMVKDADVNDRVGASKRTGLFQQNFDTVGRE